MARRCAAWLGETRHCEAGCSGAWQGKELGPSWRCRARQGKAGITGMVSLGMARPGKAGLGVDLWPGWAGHGKARQGEAWQGTRSGKAWRNGAWLGKAGQGMERVQARHSPARHGSAWRCKASPGPARQGWHGKARHGTRLDMAWQGKALQGGGQGWSKNKTTETGGSSWRHTRLL